jgi:succinylglutamate desuccinylase
MPARPTPPTVLEIPAGDRHPAYEEMLEDWERLRARFPLWIRVQEYGRTPDGLPLRLIVLEREGAFPRRPAMVMSGVTHGNEFLGIEDRLPQQLAAEAAAADRSSPIARFVDSGGAIVMVPVVNPDGYQAGTRENARHVDLNRDWDVPVAHYQGFRQTETRALADALEAMHRGQDALDYRITVDYHCCAGALLYPWGFTDVPMPEADLARHRQIAALAAGRLGVQTGVTHDVLGYHDVGTTKDYYYDHYGAAAFTFEGRPLREAGYLSRHVSWWEDLAATLLPGARPAALTLQLQTRTAFLRLAD